MGTTVSPLCLDGVRHVLHFQLLGEANHQRLRSIRPGRRDPGVGVGAPSAGQALRRRVNELCGVRCTVLGRRVFFAEQHRHACAGRWLVRSVRLSGKAANLLTRNYLRDGPTAVFVAHGEHEPRLGS